MTHLETVLTPFDFLMWNWQSAVCFYPLQRVSKNFGSGKKGAWGNYIVGKYKSTTTGLSSNTNHVLRHVVLSLLSSHKSWLGIKIGHVLQTEIHGGICLSVHVSYMFTYILVFFLKRISFLIWHFTWMLRSDWVISTYKLQLFLFYFNAFGNTAV